jgi:hypothetical protein
MCRKKISKKFSLGKVLSPYVEQCKKTLSGQGLTSRGEQKVMKNEIFSVSQPTIITVAGNVAKSVLPSLTAMHYLG